MAHGAEGVADHVGASPTAHAHPSERKYIEIAAILATITVAEVAIWYIQWFQDEGILVPMLLAMSAFKFATVVGYFMHLKFDDRRLLMVFLTGLGVAFVILMALYTLFHYHVIVHAKNFF
jgi:cytochrome c oxidase subunit 4